MALPPLRLDWLRCTGLSFFCPVTSRVRHWEDLRENLQQHIRILADEAWPLPVRQARQSLLRPALAAGWALTEHSALARSAYFSGFGATACQSLECAQCPLGEVTLRSAVLLTTPKEILATLLGPQLETATRNLVTYALWDTMAKIDNLLFLENEITWYDMVSSGWPIFAVLASLATLLTGSKFPTDESQLRIDLAQVLRPQNLQEEVISYLGPDRARFSRWVALAEERGNCSARTVLGTLLVADGSKSMALPLPQEDFLRMAQTDLRSCRAPMESVVEFFKWPWPVFHAVDWLQTPAEVQVQVLPSPLHQSFFWWHHRPREITGKLLVPRARRPGTFGFVGDNVRSTGLPHCSLVFQNAVDTLLEFLPGVRVNVVDVGSMLGDCCLWSLLRHGRGWCKAFESNELWVRLAMATLQLNGLSQEMSVNHMEITPDGPRSLDSILGDSQDALVLKIHTDGNELGLLQGAQQLLRRGHVQLAVLRTESQLQLPDGRFRPPPNAWRQWLRSSGLDRTYALRFAWHETLLVAKTAGAAALLRRSLNHTV
ncbi:unnamed protein product [Effrenium voratum]|uniref:Methyltransferase FkbM domain-containing protein n=1 Tax=Effrenium voratum TaxID=2562239 RepID=A0AA36J4N7_9DINO|nr:unnamed protein product [Effrenium voratum]